MIREPTGGYELPISPRALLRLSAAVWLTFGLAQCVQSYVLAGATGRAWTLSGALVTAMPWWLSWFVLTPVIALLTARFHFTGRFWRPLAAHIVAGTAVSSAHLAVVGSVYWFTTGRAAGVAATLGNQVQRFFGSFFLEAIVTYAGVVGVLVAMAFARAVRDRDVARMKLEAHAASVEASLTKARLDALRMELNPHFLFNTLAAISALVGQDRKADARDVIGRLSDLLRRALDGGEAQVSTVAAELAVLDDYLHIQRLRFNDRLVITVDAPDDVLTCTLPTFLLQQLVENAIRHGVEPTQGTGTVAIVARCENALLRISVRDTGPGLPPDTGAPPGRNGIGLANARARLAHLYGGKATIDVHNVDGGGVEAVVLIPGVGTAEAAP